MEPKETFSSNRDRVWSVGRAALPSELRARAIVRTIAAICLVVLAVWVVRDFLTALTWAGLIAVTVWPIYGRFVLLIPAERDVLAPLLFTLLIGLALIIPLTATIHQIALSGSVFASTLRELRESGLPVPSWLAQLPMAEYLDTWWRNNLGNPQNVREWLGHVNIESITEWGRALSGAVLQGLFHFTIMLLALFFFFRHGMKLAALLLIAAERLFGEAAELPFLLVLIGMLGGLQSFGVIGLFFGPVIMAMVLAVWRECIDSNV
jgi:predicted PurR-regulated permease PerM